MWINMQKPSGTATKSQIEREKERLNTDSHECVPHRLWQVTFELRLRTFSFRVFLNFLCFADWPTSWPGRREQPPNKMLLCTAKKKHKEIKYVA